MTPAAWLVAQARPTARAEPGRADALGDLAVGAGLARRDLGQRLPHLPLEGGADDVERHVGRVERRRLAAVEPGQHALHPRRQRCVVALDLGRREVVLQIALEGAIAVAEEHRGDALLGRRDQHAAIVGVDRGVVDMRAGAALGIGGGRHAERLVARFIDAARRAVARAIQRLAHLLAVAQRLAEALALLGDQPVARRQAELGDEALAEGVGGDADLARHLGERRRLVGVGRVEQRAGARHRLAEAELGLPVARLAALAGAEAGRFGRFRRGVEGHVLAQRRTRRAGRQAVDPGRLDREPEPAVEGPVAPLDGCPAGIRVGEHAREGGAGERHGGGRKRELGHGRLCRRPGQPALSGARRQFPRPGNCRLRH